MRGTGFTISEPVVSFYESISCKTGAVKTDEFGIYSEMIVVKSPSKHNHLYMWVESMSDELCQSIDNKHVNATQDLKNRPRTLASDFGWQVGDVRKIWSFGVPPDSVPNTIVGAAKGVQFLNEIKDHIV